MQRDRLLVQEMVDAAEGIRKLVEGVSVEDLVADRQRRDALLWNFTVLGEASSQVSAELKERSSHVPWQGPVSLRHRIVHGDWSVDLKILHNTANQQIPELASGLQAVLAELTEEPESE